MSEQVKDLRAHTSYPLPTRFLQHFKLMSSVSTPHAALRAARTHHRGDYLSRCCTHAPVCLQGRIFANLQNDFAVVASSTGKEFKTSKSGADAVKACGIFVSTTITKTEYDIGIETVAQVALLKPRVQRMHRLNKVVCWCFENRTRR